MARNRENNVDEEQSVKRGSKGKIIILALLFVLLAAGFGVGGTYIANKYFLNKSSEKSTETQATITSNEKLVSVSKFVVNLSGNTSTDNLTYVRLKISCLVADDDAKTSLKKSMPLVRNSVINVLNTKTANDLLNTSNSISTLKNDIKNEINTEYGTTIVKQVYITDLVIQ
ncbi:flagellar basal body-associated FliL family protein [Ligilactobacillus sp. WILCCON 0076]|uniref:Flagellar protein FliL n=1 Tax=Ligilactobacillus ubinensis TaxID=2876789 RepID=A0A9X2JKL3_9LACO|nr:flagellar basal body-associated FliL family protein [Ligilactobacillus ubinensis]MCP0886243.1 flagellar basal body-associated FliL family protein [Ligilactobacillus ubinensis]